MDTIATIKGQILLCVLTLMVSLPLQPAFVVAESDPTSLQQQAIKRIDHFIDHYRKTGDLESLVGELQQAEKELAASIPIFMNSGDLTSVALSKIKLGDIQRWHALSKIKLGDVQRLQERWSQALNFYQQAYKLAERAGHIAHQAEALTKQANVENSGLHDYGAAATHIEEAIRLSAMVDDKSYLFNALDYKAQIQIGSGELIVAADTIHRAFEVGKQVKDPFLLYYAYLDRGEIYHEREKKCDYQRTFALCYKAFDLAKVDYTQALSLASQFGYTGLARAVESRLQSLEERRKQIESDEKFHKLFSNQAIFHPKKPNDVLVTEKFIAGIMQEVPSDLVQQVNTFNLGDARSFYNQGNLYALQGENEKALEAYLKAVDLLETDRRTLSDEKARGTFMDDKIGFYYAPILHFLESRRFAEGFALMERSKSRAMADLLASRTLGFSRPEDKALYGASQEITATLALLQKDLFEFNSRTDRESYTVKIAELDTKIQKLEAKHHTLLSRMAKDAPRLRDLLVSQPVTLQELQQSMKQYRYEVLQYLVLEHGIVLWHIRSDAVNVKNVFLPRSAVMNKVTSLRKSMTDSNVKFDEQTAREMFLFLIQPVLELIKTQHLIIIPHEDLNHVPFQVLQNPADNRYLGERFQISYAPNATILMNIQKTVNIREGKLLAIADPDIVEAPTEVEAIAKLYPGRHKVIKDVLVKEADLKTWAPKYDLLHLSVHGLFNAAEPLLSYLKLKPDGRDDGKLTAAEMFGLSLDKTRLIVMSACETGQVEVTRANEIFGMVRALLYAGAQTLILSSWKVDSEATALWMETFYREAQTKPISEAARIALVTVKEHPKYNHPYYWGPFLMIGK